MTAAPRRGSAKVLVHSENGALDAMAMDARSSRSVNIWNRSSADCWSRWLVSFVLIGTRVFGWGLRKCGGDFWCDSGSG